MRFVSLLRTIQTTGINSKCLVRLNTFANSTNTPVLIANRHSTTAAIKNLDKLSVEDEEQALEIASRLEDKERRLLHAALEKVGLQTTCQIGTDISKKDLQSLFLVNALPFVGFGMLDNSIMIIAGEYIDQTLGALFCLSTMAAAAFGNLISDVAGVGLAHYVEILVNFVGIKHPQLNPAQMQSSRARTTANAARAFGLTIGCLIGMFPLLFFKDEEKKDDEKKKK